MPEPYVVEVDSPGCDHCRAGRTWQVVYVPGDIANSVSYEREEDAEHEASLCNLVHNRALNPAVPE